MTRLVQEHEKAMLSRGVGVVKVKVKVKFTLEQELRPKGE
jgi:hypothetical protein